MTMQSWEFRDVGETLEMRWAWISADVNYCPNRPASVIALISTKIDCWIFMNTNTRKLETPKSERSTTTTEILSVFLNGLSFLWRSLQTGPSPRIVPRKNFWRFAGARVLQAGWPSCHMTNGVKALTRCSILDIISVFYNATNSAVK